MNKEIKSKLNFELTNTNNTDYAKIIDDPTSIRFMDQTPDICMLALIKDYTCFNYIKAPTLAMKLFVQDRLNIIDELGGNVLLEFC